MSKIDTEYLVQSTGTSDFLILPDPKKKYKCSRLTDSKGFTLLMKLVMLTGERSDVYEYLKNNVDKFGTELNKQNDEGQTALMLAVRNSNTFSNDETVKLLIDMGADLNIQDSDGWTALIYATFNSEMDSSQETVKLLIDAGADLNVQDKYGRTALMSIVHNSNIESNEDLMRLFIDAGVDLNIQTYNYGDTILMYVVRGLNKYSNDKMIKLLIDAGDMSLQNNKGENIKLESKYILGRRGYSVNSNKSYINNFMDLMNSQDNVEDNKKFSSLIQKASKDGDSSMVNKLLEYVKLSKLLIQYGVSLDSDQFGQEANHLKFAAQNGHLEIAEMLLDEGAKANGYEYYQSPLEEACKSGHTKMVELLLSRGANPNGPDKTGRPKYLAKKNGYPEIAKLL